MVICQCNRTRIGFKLTASDNCNYLFFLVNRYPLIPRSCPAALRESLCAFASLRAIFFISRRSSRSKSDCHLICLVELWVPAQQELRGFFSRKDAKEGNLGSCFLPLVSNLPTAILVLKVLSTWYFVLDTCYFVLAT